MKKVKARKPKKNQKKKRVSSDTNGRRIRAKNTEISARYTAPPEFLKDLL